MISFSTEEVTHLELIILTSLVTGLQKNKTKQKTCLTVAYHPFWTIIL